MTLDTKRLRLEPWDDRRRHSWRAIAGDPEVMRFIGRGQTWDSAKADEVFDNMLAHWHDRGFGWRSLLDKSSGEWLGFAGLNVVGPGVANVAPDEVEIGWWLVRFAWARGFATEAAVAVRDEGFGRLDLGRLIARIQPANVASSRVAERIGMTFAREGTGRNDESLHIYTLDRAEWKLQRSSAD